MEPLKKAQVEGFLMFAEPEVLFGNLDELCCVSIFLELIWLVLLFIAHFVPFLAQSTVKSHQKMSKLWQNWRKKVLLKLHSKTPQLLKGALPIPEIGIDW